MTRARPLLRFLLVAAACSALVACKERAQAAELPAVQTLLQVEMQAGAVEVGAPFRLTVTRTWRKDLTPDPWDDAALKPLALGERSRLVREDPERMQERLTYRAYAFSLRPVRVGPFAFRARAADSTVHSCKAPALTVRVLPTLDAQDPGPPALPSGPHALPPPPWGPAAIFSAVAALLLGAWFLARRRRVRAQTAVVGRPAALDSDDDPRRIETWLRARPTDPQARAEHVAQGLMLVHLIQEGTGRRAAATWTADEHAQSGPLRGDAALMEVFQRVEAMRYAGILPGEATYASDRGVIAARLDRAP